MAAVSKSGGTLRDLQLALQLKIEELRQRDALIDELELELDTKDDLIRQLQVELDRHRSASPHALSSGESAGTAAAVQNPAGPDEPQRTKRQAISAEPTALDPSQLTDVTLTSYCKSKESSELIQKALMDNDFMKHLEHGQILTIMDCMHPTSLAKGCCVIQEGDDGSTVYVLSVRARYLTSDERRPPAPPHRSGVLTSGSWETLRRVKRPRACPPSWRIMYGSTTWTNHRKICNLCLCLFRDLFTFSSNQNGFTGIKSFKNKSEESVEFAHTITAI